MPMHGEYRMLKIHAKLSHEVGVKPKHAFVLANGDTLILRKEEAFRGQRIQTDDIYVDGRKICGILIENSIRGKNLAHSIVGIGLNVNQCNFDASLPNPTSMQLYLKGSSGKYHQSFDMNKCLETIMEIFKGYVQLYMNGKVGLGRLRRMYLSQLWRKDERTGL